MRQQLRNLWAALRAWLASQFMVEPPTVQPPDDLVEDDHEYHTMRRGEGQNAAVTKGLGYHNGRKL